MRMGEDVREHESRQEVPHLVERHQQPQRRGDPEIGARQDNVHLYRGLDARPSNARRDPSRHVEHPGGDGRR